MLVTLAANCLCGLAKGLQNHFSIYAANVSMPVCFIWLLLIQRVIENSNDGYLLHCLMFLLLPWTYYIWYVVLYMVSHAFELLRDVYGGCFFY